MLVFLFSFFRPTPRVWVLRIITRDQAIARHAEMYDGRAKSTVPSAMDDMALEETLKLTFNISHFVQGKRPVEAATTTTTTSTAHPKNLFIGYGLDDAAGGGGGGMLLTGIDLYGTYSGFSSGGIWRRFHCDRQSLQSSIHYLIWIYLLAKTKCSRHLTR